MYLFVDNLTDNAKALNSDLENLNKWASDWLVKFCPSKTKSMIITKKKKKNIYPPLEMDGVLLTNVNSHKHLGVTLANNLSWNEHIEACAIKAGKCLDILNALKYKLDRKTLETLYFSFIRSQLEYASIVWDNCSQQLSDLLESVQYRAAKIVSGAICRTSHDIVNQELNWTSLKERRKNQRLRVFYKSCTGNSPIYMQTLMAENTRERERYNLRGDRRFIPPKARTSTFQNSFVPQTVRDWNNLDIEHRRLFQLKLLHQN